MGDRLHGEQGWRDRPKIRSLLRNHAEVDRDLEISQALGLTLAQFDRLPADERALRIERWNVKRATCPDCGNPLSECTDPERKWYPYRRICYATMEREAASDAYTALHGEDAAFHNGTFTDWGKVRSAEHPYSAMAGVSIGVAKTDLTPWDMFTTDRDASPVQSVAEQSEEVESMQDPGEAVNLPGRDQQPG